MSPVIFSNRPCPGLRNRRAAMAPRDRPAAMLALAALWPLACSGANPATSTPPDPTCNTQIGYSPFKYGPGVPGMQWFTKAKLGMFMHYGPVSQWGTEISFPLVCKQLPCTVRAMNNSNVVIKTQEELAAHRQAYADLAKTFNPTQFDADAMAQMAKDAGFEYLMCVLFLARVERWLLEPGLVDALPAPIASLPVHPATPSPCGHFRYTTVHCDGFLNWNSSLSNYTIMNTPYSRDLYGDLANALRRKGMRVGAYICPSLWNNDDYWAPNALTALGPVCRPNYTPDANAANTTAWTRYLTYLHGLVAELADKCVRCLNGAQGTNHSHQTDSHSIGRPPSLLLNRDNRCCLELEQPLTHLFLLYGSF